MSNPGFLIRGIKANETPAQPFGGLKHWPTLRRNIRTRFEIMKSITTLKKKYK